MNLRTGDVLVWRSTNFYDILSDNTIMINGLHAGIVLVGDRIREFSACGPSPSRTYVTFLVDQIFPIEECIGHVWHRPNGAALWHIQRMEGPNVSDDYAYEVIKDCLKLEKLSGAHSVYIAIAAYFKVAGIAPSTGWENKRWNVCSLVIGYCLQRFGLLQEDAVPNNLLPLDFWDLNFYQKYPYRKIEIFDKKTYTYEWFLSGLLISAGLWEPPLMHCPVVDEMLNGYKYPRMILGKKEVKDKSDQYLTDTEN